MARNKSDKLKEVQAEFNIMRHRVEKLESILSDIYKKHPEIHYEYCSEWAREHYFDKFPDGTIKHKVKIEDLR